MTIMTEEVEEKENSEQREEQQKIATPSATRKIIEGHHFRWRKKWGQNFLVEPDVVKRIIAAARLDETDIVLEIGPGLGGMTQELLGTAGHVVALEIDSALIEILKQLFHGNSKLTLCHGDALKLDYQYLLSSLQEKGHFRDGFVVVANLPYYITTPLIFHLLENGAPWRRMVLMVQKEVADRMSAAADCKEYGALSVAIQYRAAVSTAFTVPPTVFQPRPSVDSAVVVLERLERPAVSVHNEELFFQVVAAAFGQRRKTLLNALASGLHLDKAGAATILREACIDGNRRGETLTLQEFAAISNAMCWLR